MHALADDIIEGRLPSGSRVPAQREVADVLRIGLGSATKAYAILERRGLIRTERGRGSFVALLHGRDTPTLDLSVNTPPAMLSERVLAQTLIAISRQIDPALLSRYPPTGGHSEHRRIMANWLQRAAFAAPPLQILLCNSAQQALCVALALLRKPGSVILTEPYTYPGAVALSKQFGYRLVGLQLDAEGVTPDSLEASLKQQSACDDAPVIYLTPTLQNPTTLTMSEHRRRAIARISRKYGALIIEDEIYALASSNPIPPIASFAPERTFYISSLSKTLSPGLRIGSLVVPEAYVAAAEVLLHKFGMMVAPLSCAVMARWLTDGTAVSMVGSIHSEINRRTALAKSLLTHVSCNVDPDAFHLWIPLTRTDAEHCRSACASLGIVVTAPELVTVDSSSRESGLRICIGSTSMAELAEVFPKIASIVLGRIRPSGPRVHF
jgi:DNA-binding transcriptional MocR family regulator